MPRAGAEPNTGTGSPQDFKGCPSGLEEAGNKAAGLFSYFAPKGLIYNAE